MVTILKCTGISNHYVTTGNYTVLQVNYTSKQTNLQKKRSDPWLPDVGAGGKGMKMVKR